MKMVVFRALMMEAANASETLVNFCQLHGATAQKTAIFILSVYHSVAAII
jgi:hypothetical protein